jgi:hypothetical protein
MKRLDDALLGDLMMRCMKRLDDALYEASCVRY